MTDIREELARDLWEEHAAALCGGAENSDDAMEIAVARLIARAVAAEREKVVQWMLANSFATGHGDTLEDLLAELKWQVAEMRARI